ncbi:MAG: outer membrane beta-barrel protein [Flammeovirgaceae bacterium]|nr:outer membrane beta-barrel protein [Flammeovirgaceae bacterium]
MSNWILTSLNVAGTEASRGGIGFTKSKFKDDDGIIDNSSERKSFKFNISPKIGFFISNNFALGLLSNYRHSKSRFKSGYGGGISTSTYGNYNIGPFLRYYIPTKRVLPFFEIGSSIGKSYEKYRSRSPYEETEGKSSEFIISAGIGMAVPLGEKVNFDILLGYKKQATKLKENNDNNIRLVAHTIGLDLGFTILLGSN